MVRKKTWRRVEASAEVNGGVWSCGDGGDGLDFLIGGNSAQSIPFSN
jgi:hypothetical protein